MDGQLLSTMDVETKPSKLVLLQSVLRRPDARFTCRKAITSSAPPSSTTISSRSSPTTRTPTTTRRTSSSGPSRFVGPYPVKVEKASRKKILICDPATGQACVEKIVTNLAHHAYRRPVTKTEVAGLMKFVTLAKAQGQSTEQGIQLALEAMLVSPEFLFRIERDLESHRSRKVPPDFRHRTGQQAELFSLEFDARRRTADPRRGQ